MTDVNGNLSKLPHDVVELVMITSIMGFTTPEAIQYIQARGYNVTRDQYLDHKTKIKIHAKEKIHEIAATLRERHTERIEELYSIKTCLWRLFHSVDSPQDQVRILREIRDILPYLSTYEEATQHVLEQDILHAHDNADKYSIEDARDPTKFSPLPADIKRVDKFVNRLEKEVKKVHDNTDG